MFSLTRILVASALALTIAAVPNGQWGEPTTTVTVTATPTATSSSDCNTGGGAQCCQNVGNPSSSPIASILSILGIVVQGVEDIIGVDCSPLVLGQYCSNTPVCCEQNGIGNIISIGCIVL
ncbi:fungal hydrophobin [Fomitopsis betulina]|nr:fungal hydrophobin [Fomitopsis betulina]